MTKTVMTAKKIDGNVSRDRRKVSEIMEQLRVKHGEGIRVVFNADLSYTVESGTNRSDAGVSEYERRYKGYTEDELFSMSMG